VTRDLSIILVGTNEWHVLEPCLASVFRETPGIDMEVIVVDNNSTDGTGENMRRVFPGVRYFRNESNRGFAASNNVGFREARGTFLLMLNPDTIIYDRAILRTLDFMRRQPSAGIAACLLELKDGTIQESLRTFPTPGDLFFEAFFLHRLFPRSRLFGRYHMTWFGYDVTRPVDWASGAYLMIRREVLEKVGLLDEQFYMYTEEVDLCLRARRAGLETWFTPEAKVTHYWGGKSAFSKRSVVWTHGSQVLFFQKHFRGFRLALMITLKCLELLNRVVLHGTTGILTADPRRLALASYTLAALGRIVRGRWKYRPGFAGPVAAWTV
jgi:GT2 family glycosyltransferase